MDMQKSGQVLYKSANIWQAKKVGWKKFQKWRKNAKRFVEKAFALKILLFLSIFCQIFNQIS